ncbi:MAG: 50S ribosomal protein L4 [Alphaproteobacteria bacterium]
MKLAVKNMKAEDVGEIELSDAIFDMPERKDILHRMVNYQLAKRRSGCHKTKTVGEIQGSTKKPFRQKGTGSARQGTKRAAQMRGGQTTFGPVVRDHSHKLPKKVRKLALKTALSVKAREGKIIVVDELKADTPKTAALRAELGNFGYDSALFVDAAFDQNFALASRNIPKTDLLPTAGANVYDILRRDTLVITKAALAQIEERLK